MYVVCIDKFIPYCVVQDASWSDYLPKSYLREGKVETSLEMTH